MKCHLYFPVYVRIYGGIYEVYGKLCNAPLKNGKFSTAKNSLPGRDNSC